MTTAIVIPIHDKPAATIAAVLEAARHQDADELIVVLDRAPKPLRDLAATNGNLLVELDGKPGWRSPCISFNAGLEQVTADTTIICHSDVVMAPTAAAYIRQAMPQRPAVYFGTVLESDPDLCKGPGSAGPVLCSSLNPRALTFLMAAPTSALKAIGGWDTAFQDGVCYEDDDLTARLWNHGLDAIFDDAFTGTHISHDRAYFIPYRTAPNMTHMLRKHGALRFHDKQRITNKLTIHHTQGRTEWRHPSVP